jgi:ATP-dependent Clp protease protease subunit
MSITTLLDVACPSIRLTGEIDMPACYALIDEMKLLHDYYRFRTIELQIDSPGGSADALGYLVLSLRDWREGNGRTLKTVALNQACSAAALLLSLGTMGHRQASPASRLLYHPMRTEFSQGTVRTGAQLRMTSRLIEEWDGKFLDMLASHVCREESERPAYRRKLKRLFQKERFIEPNEAVSYCLIDKVV